MTRTLRLLALLAALAALATTLPGEVPCCDLQYLVQPDPESGTVEVTLDIRGFDGDSLVLVRQSARPLPGLLGEDPTVEDARLVSWSMVAGSPRWVYARPVEGWEPSVRVRYRLAITAERPLNAWAVGLDRDLLYAPAEALFIVPSMPELAAQHAPVRVAWDLPRGWEAFTGWSGGMFRGTRTLLKTNVLAGEIERHRIAACGVQVELGVHGEWTFDPETLVGDLGRLACAARIRLGEPDVDHYTVSLVQARFPMTSGNRNGPHAIAFVHSVPGGEPPSTRLLAHELVHLWQRFDASAWFQEGVNDYMALRLAREADLLDEAGYAEQLASIDSVYRAHPRRSVWSFADEAVGAPPFGPSDEYLAYRKGAIVGLGLDRELRLRSGGRVDLAALWRDMNARARFGHVAWSDDDIATRAAALAEGSMTHFFDHWVAGTSDLPRPDALLANLPDPPAPALDHAGISTLAAFVQTAFGRLSR
jgi:predicted metalloprotease with PDZ domain